MVQPVNIMKPYIVLGGVGAILCSLGFTLLFKWPSIFQTLIHEQMQITPGSHAFNLWRDSPVPMYMSFYMFNWTNYDRANHEKPKLVEVGPYRFNLEEKKTNITSNPNGTVTFQIRRVWHFDEAKSNGSLDDMVTTLNPVALSAAFSARNWTYMTQVSVGVALKMTTIQVTQKVGEMLFHGYSDTLITVARTFPAFAGVNIPFDKFAWFYNRNGSSDAEGVFNMDTGENDIYQLGKLHNWNYKTATGYYPGACGMLNGSAGELFPPHQTKEKNVELYSADLCRSVSLSFQREVDIYGIQGYQFGGDEKTFDNGTLDEQNECFSEGESLRSGVLNVTSCRHGAPGYVSFPHFLLADEHYPNSVEGLKPDPEKHGFYITLEPETGIPLDVAARFQVNLLMADYDFVGILQGVPTTIFPMLWFEHRATITPELAYQIKLALSAPTIGQIFAIFLALCGLLLIVYAIYGGLKKREKMNNELKELKLEMRSVVPNLEPLLDNKISETGIPRVMLKKNTLINCKYF